MPSPEEYDTSLSKINFFSDQNQKLVFVDIDEKKKTWVLSKIKHSKFLCQQVAGLDLEK